MKTTISKFLAEENGQTATEYMLLVSVVVIAIVAVAYAYSPMFKNGGLALAQDVALILELGKIGSIGMSR